MLLCASIYYVARRALHAACCPSYPASCLVRAASCTCAEKYQHRPEGCRCRCIAGLWVFLGGAACRCIGLRAAIPARSPRRGRRRDSVGGRGGIRPPARQRCWGSRGLPSRSIPQPRHSGPVTPRRHGTPQRHVIPRRHGIPQQFGIPQRHGIPWDGSDRSCHTSPKGVFS